jgi:Fe-S-cluster-containing hydrogenase component 2
MTIIFLISLAMLLGLTSGKEVPSAVAQEPTPTPTLIARLANNYQVYLPLVVRAPTGSTPIINSFSANPSTVASGGASTLSWNVSGATTLTIMPTIGTVTGPSGSGPVNPTTTTEYTLTAANAFGTTTAKTTVTVSSSGGGNAAFWLPYTTTTGTIIPTYGTSVGIDGAGGIHVSYAIFSDVDNGQRPAYYTYCAANCAQPANWTRVRLSNYAQDVRLALDSAGHPRLLLYTSDNPALPSDTHEYQYAVCNSGCVNSANWTISVVAIVNETAGQRSFQNNHYFALDAQGRPAFVYADYSNDHYGTFYTHCDANCETAANWSEVLLADGKWFLKPSLAFTPDGKPRLLLDYFVYAEQRQAYVTNLLYLGCDTACDTLTNWYILILHSSIGNADAQFSLRLDSQGRPRIALYTGNYVSQPLQPYRLHYLWCNTACFQNAVNDWNQALVGTPDNHGREVDLALDATNRPRLAYERDGAGLGYAWCNVNCESTSATWQANSVESTSAIIGQYPELPQYSCPIQTWFNGKRPSLALDVTGHPRIGYDAEHWWGGYDAFGNRCHIEVPLARFALFNQP